MSEHTSTPLFPIMQKTRQLPALSQMRHTSYVYQKVSKNAEFRDFTLRTVPEIFKSKRDPWREVLENKQDLSKVMMAAKELF
jgi:DNA primase